MRRKVFNFNYHKQANKITLIILPIRQRFELR